MNRRQQILAGLLVLQLILIVVVFLPRGTTVAAGTPLLADLKVEDISSLTIRDDQGNSIRLVRQADKWLLPEAGDFPADGGKITPALDKLLKAKIDRPVTQTEGSLARLQVADNRFVRQVELTTAGGTTRTLYLGASAGGSSVYARLAGKNEVYLARGLATWEIGADASAWIDTLYLSVPQTDVAGITLSNANGQMSFLKDAQGTWSLTDLAAGETPNSAAITGLLSQVSSLRMVRPLGKTDQPAYGLAQPSAVLTLTTRKDGQEQVRTLTVGAKDAGDNTYVVKLSDSPYYVRVSEYTVQDLVTKKRTDFLQLPPTPVVTPTPTP